MSERESEREREKGREGGKKEGNVAGLEDASVPLPSLRLHAGLWSGRVRGEERRRKVCPCSCERDQMNTVGLLLSSPAETG